MKIKNQVLKQFVGVDLGGTNIRSALIEYNNKTKTFRIKNKYEELTKSKSSKKIITKQIIDSIKKVITEKVSGIGIAVPTIVDEYGYITTTENIKGLKSINIKKELEKEFKLKVTVENDAKCFAYQKNFEVKRKNKKIKELVGVVIGTGIGSAIIMNDNIVHGSKNGAGEIGSIPYLDSDLENYTSGKFFKRKKLDAKEVFEKALKSDKKSIKLFEEFGKHLGHAISIISLTVNPEIIVFGGSISKAKKFFEKSMKKQFKKTVPKEIYSNTKILFSKDENDNLLGIISIAMNAKE